MNSLSSEKKRRKKDDSIWLRGVKSTRQGCCGGRSRNWDGSFVQEGKDSKQGKMELVGMHDKLCEERKWNLCVLSLTHIHN